MNVVSVPCPWDWRQCPAVFQNPWSWSRSWRWSRPCPRRTTASAWTTTRGSRNSSTSSSSGAAARPRRRAAWMPLYWRTADVSISLGIHAWQLLLVLKPISVCCVEYDELGMSVDHRRTLSHFLHPSMLITITLTVSFYTAVVSLWCRNDDKAKTKVNRQAVVAILNAIYYFYVFDEF